MPIVFYKLPKNPPLPALGMPFGRGSGTGGCGCSAAGTGQGAASGGSTGHGTGTGGCGSTAFGWRAPTAGGLVQRAGVVALPAARRPWAAAVGPAGEKDAARVS
jgi:hypothetical protein